MGNLQLIKLELDRILILTVILLGKEERTENGSITFVVHHVTERI